MNEAEHRIGRSPVLTLAAMGVLVAIGVFVPFSGWGSAVDTASILASFRLLTTFLREGDRRGAPATRVRAIALGVYGAAGAIGYLLRTLWSRPS